ncbi:unnamed protein product [Soboliphyme baturini]|uniref:RanBD1 domain-containing protein n=1 Tax=Soboliphyme baturini TaxID=241478 RepID=A0A183J063_9BILA|nr:unnamed protein product [Soboliphyme baturini]
MFLQNFEATRKRQPSGPVIAQEIQVGPTTNEADLKAESRAESVAEVADVDSGPNVQKVFTNIIPNLVNPDAASLLSPYTAEPVVEKDGGVENAHTTNYETSDVKNAGILSPMNKIGCLPSLSSYGSELFSQSATPKVRNEQKDTTAYESEKDGHYYSNLAAASKEWLMNKCDEFKRYTTEVHLDNEAQGKVRVALGKAALLLNNKFAKFEELVQQNLNPIPNCPFTVKNSDLDGYWQLVSIELDNMKNCFDGLANLPASGSVADKKDDSGEVSAESKHGKSEISIKHFQIGVKSSGLATKNLGSERLRAMRCDAVAKKKARFGVEEAMVKFLCIFKDHFTG